jgi:hypothetical protein
MTEWAEPMYGRTLIIVGCDPKGELAEIMGIVAAILSFKAGTHLCNYRVII